MTFPYYYISNNFLKYLSFRLKKLENKSVSTMIEEISKKKSDFALYIILCAQIIIISVVIYKAPSRNNSEQFLATQCYDPLGHEEERPLWFQPRGQNKCLSAERWFEDLEVYPPSLGNIVFSVQMPLPRYGKQLDYSRFADEF